MNKEKIKKEFSEYVRNYNEQDPKIALKIAHTYRVADLSEKIARNISVSEGSETGALLSEQDILEAWTIGMLHDIARFEQVRIYNTFMDRESVDHADFGVKLLFEDGLVKRFTDYDERLYREIEKAIANHNKYRLPDNLDNRELVFCKILRDADKIDILRVNYETPMEQIYNTTREQLEEDSITDEVYEAFFKKSAIEHSIKRSKIDSLVGHASLCFELEYDISREIVSEQGYLFKLLEFESKNTETAKRLNVIRDYMREYYGKN